MKKFINSLFLLIIFIIWISCSKSKYKETEPNNTFMNANPVELNKEYSGFLHSENDIDYYILNNSQEQILRIELSGIKGVNHAIHIFKDINSKPSLLKIIDDNRKSAPEIFANIYVEPGRYYFCIMHGERDIKKGNDETPYKLLITSRPWMDEEKEPNDNAFSATDITGKKNIRGFYSPSRNSLNTEQKNKMQEADWYKFNVEIIEGRPVLMDIHLSGVNNVDGVLSVFNSNIDEIIMIDSAGAGEGETVSDLGIKESGVYYLQISSKNFQFNNESPYELKITTKEFDSSFELEPNNSFDRSNIIQGNKISGRINFSGDIDFYQFIPPEKNRFYRIKCTGGTGIDPAITIYDSGNNKLFKANNNGPGKIETIPCHHNRNTVYLSISSDSLTSDESNYTLEFKQIEIFSAVEMEPNNSKASANIINKNVTGFTNNKNDVDYYLIKTDHRKKVRINAKGVKNGKIKLSITDPLGFIIKSKEVESDNEITFFDTVDKKGYIIVESINSDYDSYYTISIED